MTPGLGRSPGEGHGNPLQYSCLENPMDRGACWATVHGVTKSQTRLSDQHLCCHKWQFIFWGVLSWWLRWQRICFLCRRPGFDSWVGNIPQRREWLLTPVFLPGESHGQRSLAGYSPWGPKELDMTEQPTLSRSMLPSVLTHTLLFCLLPFPLILKGLMIVFRPSLYSNSSFLHIEN